MLSPPPLRTVLVTFTTHGSSKPIIDWLPQMARLLIAGVLALFTAFLAASNIRQNKPSLPRPMTGSPVARQHPFGLGIGPIQQLMVSPCLSAAGLRFLQPPVPAEDLTLPCGRVTDLCQTSSGLPCSASLRDNRGRRPLYAGACGVCTGACGIPLSHAAQHHRFSHRFGGSK